MNNRDDILNKQEKDCLYRYQRDILRIEDEQDKVKQQRSLLSEMDELMYEGTKRMHGHLETLADSTSDPHTCQMAIARSNQMVLARIKATEDISHLQEQLIKEERILADSHDKREKEYREELKRSSDRPESTRPAYSQ